MKYIYISILSLLLLGSCSKSVLDGAAETVNSVEESELDQSFRATVPTPGPARKIQIGKAESFDLANGLKVIVVENHKIPRVSYQITLRNEPIIEGDQAGFVSFAGGLISRGTTTRTKAEIDEAVDFIGGSLSSSSSGIFASALTKHSDALMDVVTDVLYNPSFPEEELEKIRTQTLSGLETTKTDADAIMGNVASRVNYGENHPYGEIQTVGSTKNITLDRCKDYYNRFFIPNNAYLVIVGDISLDEAKKSAERYFGKWKKKPFKPVVNKKVSTPNERNVSFAHKEGAVQSVVRVTYPVDLEPGHEDNVTASLMNSILGGSFSSRLAQNLREDKAYTYGAYSSLSADPIIGSFNASASVRNEVTDSSVTEFLFELDKIRTEPVSKEELQSMKNYRTGSFARSLESPQTIARFALNTIRYNLSEDYYQTYLERMNNVTTEDIQAMAIKYIHPDRANIVVVGDKDKVAENLLAFDTDGQIDYYDAFGGRVEYNATVPADASATSVIEDYLSAIGGKQKLTSIKSVSTVMNSDMMGQSITIETYQKAPNKFAMIVGNGSMVFQEQRFDGDKAMSSAMGQKQVFTEGPELEALKFQAKIIPQLEYLSDDFMIELTGIESVEGSQCYKVQVTDANGKTSTEYYALEDGLLVRTIATQEAGGQQMIITTDFMNYLDYDGVRFPELIKVSGAMPMPLEMRIKEIKINDQIEDSVFSVSR